MIIKMTQIVKKTGETTFYQEGKKETIMDKWKPKRKMG